MREDADPERILRVLAGEPEIDYLLTDVSMMVENGDDDTSIHMHVQNELGRSTTLEEFEKVEERIELIRS